MIEPAYGYFPGTANNRWTWTNPTPPADAAVDWRADFIRPPKPAAPLNHEIMGVPLYIRVTPTALLVIMVANDGSSLLPSTPWATLEADPRFPAAGERLQIRGTWDPVDDRISAYWRPWVGLELDDDTGWTFAASNVYLGRTGPRNDATGTVGSTAATFAMAGKVYRIMSTYDGVRVLDINPNVDVTDPTALTFKATTGQTVTVGTRPNVESVTFPGTTGSHLSTPDAAALDIVGDITIIARVTPTTWALAMNPMLASKWETGQFSYRFFLTSNGYRFEWTADGSTTAGLGATSAGHGFVDGTTRWVGVTLDVDNGSAGWTMRYWWSDTDTNVASEVAWTQLGTNITVATATSIHAGTAALFLGANNAGTGNLYPGELHYLSIRTGIGAGGTVGGTEVFRLDRLSTAASAGSTTIVATTNQGVTRTGNPVMNLGSDVAALRPRTYTAASTPVQFTNPAPWRVDLCTDWQRVAVCTAYRFKGKIHRRGPGTFTLESSPAGIPPAEGFDPRDINTIRLIAGRRILFPGYVRGDNGGFYAELDDTGTRWRWTGEDVWWRLRKRLAFPDPSVTSGWAVTHDVRTGIASSVLAGYLEANLGAGAHADRADANFQVADELAGTTLTFGAAFETLEELTTRIAEAGNFDVNPEVDFDGTITIRLANARDLSSVVVFSDRGDLLASRGRFQQPETTYTLSGGTGDGLARIYRSATNGATGAARYEQFSDVSSLSQASEVQADADMLNAVGADRYAISSELSAAMAELAVSFGLRLGDRVGIGIDGRRYSLPIEAVEFDITPERQIMTPQFGDAIPDELGVLLRKIA